MNDYLLYLETLYLATKKIRLRGPKSIVRHLEEPSNSPIFGPLAGKGPEADFMIDALMMVAAGLSIDEVTFYMDGYRHRLITQDKADVHLVQLVFRTVWAIAHSDWDPVTCTEFGRSTVPLAKSMKRKDWADHCNDLELERTQANVNWDQMVSEINRMTD